MVMNDRALGKVLKYHLAPTEGDEADYKLTFRQARALVQTIEYFRWTNRHISLPDDLSSQTELDIWTDDLKARLLKEIVAVLDCAELYDCADTIFDIIMKGLDGTIDTDASQALRDALKDMLVNDPSFVNKLLKGYPTIGGEIGNTDDLNKLWAQCVQIIEYSNEVIVQLLDVLEVQSNNLELAKNALNDLPFFGFLLDAIPITSWLETADYFVDIIGEQYASGYDETVSPDASKYIMCCALFCLCKDDKKISIERICNALATLLNPFTTVSLDNISEFIESVIGTNDNSTVVTYCCFMLMWGTAKFSSIFGLEHVTEGSLSMIMKLAENDANNDWTELCEDCAVNEFDINVQTCGASGQNTGYPIANGIDYTISASTNTWVYDSATAATTTAAGQAPDPFTSGIAPTLKCLILMAKIGSGGAWFPVGYGTSFTASSSGELYFSVNELNGGGGTNTYADNSGLIHVIIT